MFIVVPRVTLTRTAHTQLAELVTHEDEAGMQVETTVQGLLDVLESNPADRRVRTVRYWQPPVWSARVPTPVRDDRWVLLWTEEVADHVRVVYIGSQAFETRPSLAGQR